MAKKHIYDSGLMILKTLEYLHNLPEPPIAKNKNNNDMIKVTPTAVAQYLEQECSEPTTPATAKKILNTIADSDTGYCLKFEKGENGKKDQYWFRRTFTLEQISLLSSIISSSMFLSEEQISLLLKQLISLTSKKNEASLSLANHFYRPVMMNEDALNNLRIIHEAINNRETLKFYNGAVNSDKQIYYAKPVRGKKSKYEQVTLVSQDGKKKSLSEILDKPKKGYGDPVICFPYSLVWDNSRCYLICGIEKENDIVLWNYRVDRMFELKKYPKITYRDPKSSRFYNFETQKIDVEKYLNSVFKMFTSNDPITCVKIKFKKSLTRVIVEKFGYDIKIENSKENDNYAEVNVEVQISQQFYGWLAGFKAIDIQLISPQKEVSNYIEYLQKAIEIYQNNANK